MSDAPRIFFYCSLPDSLNTNRGIRFHVYEALVALLGEEEVTMGTCFSALDHLRRDRFDLVLILANALDPGLHRIRATVSRRKTPIAVWVHDDPYEIDDNFDLLDHVDFLFTNDRTSLAYYRRGGERTNAFHLPMAACHAAHFRPVPEDDAHYVRDLFFCGVGFENRRRLLGELLETLRARATAVVGPEWPEEWPFVTSGRIGHRELIEGYNRSRIVFHLPRAHMLANTRYRIVPSTPGPRLFEAALAGGFQLTPDERPEVGEYYRVGEEIEVFRSPADFDAKVKRYLGSPDHRLRMARAAQERTLREHLYVHRVRDLLRVVFPGLGVPEPDPSPPAACADPAMALS